MTYITDFLRSVWDIFSIEEPHLGISFGSIYLGVFVVSLSLKILLPILGIGGRAVRGLGKRSSSSRVIYRKAGNDDD